MSTGRLYSDVMANSVYQHANDTLPPDNVSTTSRPAETFLEQTIENALVEIVLPIVIFVGTIGNVTSFAVLIRARMRNTSVYFFLMILAVADTLVVYVSGFKTWISVVIDFHLISANSATCRTLFFLTMFSSNVAAWMVVLVTFDRFVAVWFPLRATTWCTVKRALIATTVLTLIVIIYSVHVFWTFEVRYLPRRRRSMCLPALFNGKIPAFMLGPFQTLSLVTYCVLPFAIILILNGVIVVRLRWTSPALRAGMAGGASAVSTAGLESTCSPTMGYQYSETTISGSAPGNSRSAQQRRVTYMLLTVSFTWLLLTAPFACFSLFFPHPGRDPHSRAVQRLIKTVCFLLWYTNHGINFFLYCLTGRKFRRELKDMFLAACPCLCRRRLARNSPSVKTMRSHCVEMEPLNESLRAAISNHHQQQYFADANDVTERCAGNDITECNGMRASADRYQ